MEEEEEEEEEKEEEEEVMAAWKTCPEYISIWSACAGVNLLIAALGYGRLFTAVSWTG